MPKSQPTKKIDKRLNKNYALPLCTSLIKRMKNKSQPRRKLSQISHVTSDRCPECTMSSLDWIVRRQKLWILYVQRILTV